MDSVVDETVLDHMSDLCRVSVVTGTLCVDMALPATVPIAVLLPMIVDIIAAQGGDSDLPLRPLRLTRPGQPAPDSSNTLSQCGIHDGTVLTLLPETIDLPVPVVTEAQALTDAVVPAARDWTRESARYAALLGALAMVALSGYLAVPGGPAAPNMLLAAASTAAAAGIALRAGCHARVTLVAVSSFSILVAISALAVSFATLNAVVAGALLVSGSMFMSALSGRAAIAVTGLSPKVDGSPAVGLAMRAVRAHQVLTGLVVGSSAASTVGVALVTVGAGPDWRAYLFAAAVACGTLLRSRSQQDLARGAALVTSGILCVAFTLVALARSTPAVASWTWLAAAVLAGAAIGVGLLNLPLTPSPLLLRLLELAEWAMMATIVPVLCWLCGAYGALRGLSLR